MGKTEAPAFCQECGNPHPWTEQRLATAQQFADEEAHFTTEEREQFQQSLAEIVKETPNAPLAIGRFRRLMAKGGKAASDGLRDILVDVLSEAVKKTIWPS